MAALARVEQAARARGLDEGGETPRFRTSHGLAEGRELIPPAALVLHLHARLLGELDDQSVEQHALDRAVQRARPESHPPGGEIVHFAHDRVAMVRAVGERQQDVEDRRRQRGQLGGVTLHVGYIHIGHV